MFTPEMMESVKKVEATRAQRLGVEPRRMTADEKDALLKEFHPDYREEAFAEIKVGRTRDRKRRKSWCICSILTAAFSLRKLILTK